MEFNDPSILQVGQMNQNVSPKAAEGQKTMIKKSSPGIDSLTKWAVNHVKKLDERVNIGLDATEFVNILRTIESPYEVKDTVMGYFGETKDAKNFASNFVQKRIELKKREAAEQAKQEEREKAKAQLEKRKQAQMAAQQQKIEQERKTSNESGDEQ